MKNWKVVVGVLGVFLLGMLAGGLVTARLVHQRAQRGFAAGFPRAAEFAARRLNRELRLDSDQQRQVLAALRDAQQEVRAVYGRVRRRLDGERLLRVVARHADIWNCPNNAAPQLPTKLDSLRRHCDALGRDPGSIEVSEQCVVVLGSGLLRRSRRAVGDPECQWFGARGLRSA